MISEANCIFEKPFNFYGGYLMQMMYKKKDVITNATVNHLLKVIEELKKENELMNTDREAVNNVAVFNFDLVQRDADRIKA